MTRLQKENLVYNIDHLICFKVLPHLKFDTNYRWTKGLSRYVLFFKEWYGYYTKPLNKRGRTAYQLDRLFRKV
jgi:hypothetical protein